MKLTTFALLTQCSTNCYMTLTVVKVKQLKYIEGRFVSKGINFLQGKWNFLIINQFCCTNLVTHSLPKVLNYTAYLIPMFGLCLLPKIICKTIFYWFIWTVTLYVCSCSYSRKKITDPNRQEKDNYMHFVFVRFIYKGLALT